MNTSTVSDQNTSSDNSKEADNSREKFLFDCDYLIMFCTNLEGAVLEDQTDSMLEVKLEDLEKRWVQVQNTFQTLMLCNVASTSKDFKENAKINFNACSEAYYLARSQIWDMLRITNNSTAQRSSLRLSLPMPTTNFPQTNSADSSAICIKVPPCDTEVFKGGYEQWPSFRDMFTAVYVNHPKLTKAQKLYHLRNKTQGNAGAIVKRYSLCDENFDLAWSALKSRYENTRVLVDKQLNILFNIPVSRNESSESIQRIQSTVGDCLATLNTLNVDTNNWDPILIHLVSTKLPDDTLSMWEQSLKSHRDLPKWSQMEDFLTKRYEVVERIASIRSTRCNSLPQGNNDRKIQTYLSQDDTSTLCKLCESEHSIRMCPKFRKFTVQERIDYIFRNKFCNNCLSSSHSKPHCKSKHTCIYCKRNHHSLLHMKTRNISNPSLANANPKMEALETTNSNIASSTDKRSISSQTQIHAHFASNRDTILLRTALVKIESRGDIFTVRALIDPGSQRTFISEKVRSRLQIPYQKSHFEIVGIGGQTQISDKECEFVVYSSLYDFRFSINAIVLPKLTKRLPEISFDIPNISELENLQLADPFFNKSGQIDLILGNDSERFINMEGIKKNLCGGTSAYNTVFGWVLSGPIVSRTHSFTTSATTCDEISLSSILRKLWEQEEIPKPSPISEEDTFCEEYYKATTKRLKDGRYMVRLPFKKEFPKSIFLGSSRFIALAQYSGMEKSLSKKPELSKDYNSVLQEYIRLDHVEETSSCELKIDDKYYSYYLPHHAVVRPEHKTTKVRIVFNASRKTKSGYSLNNVLCTGPTLQNDLASVILNWRKYKYVFGGDIQKMYRQILIHPDDRPYQRMLFQNTSQDPIKDYQLKTVTFGVNCAPFLALRTLLQLASDCEQENPDIAAILRKETYVDDILSGGFSIEETCNTQMKLISILKSAGFPLKKLTSNKPQVLAQLPTEDLYDIDFLRRKETSTTKTLGIKWNAATDTFSYTFSPSFHHPITTKRKILSAVAQLFDPAGWISPVIIRGKILLQQLWLEGLQWDDEISAESLQKWNSLLTDLPSVEQFSIPRWLQFMPTDTVQIHGFADASKSAYCACVYVRSQTSNFVVSCNLLVSKSKVAPLKTISLPRLELNGALLLAQLVHYVVNFMDININEILLWTDSSIVLGWLAKSPSTWETYIANRTSQILQLVPNANWFYVSTHENPADLGTRGCKPQDLVNNSLWWNGPNWITKQSSSWPKRNPLAPPEVGKNVQTLHASVQTIDILSRFSSYNKALRVLSYVFRFVHNSLSKYKRNNLYTNFNLTQNEVNIVKNRLIMISQTTYYKDEYKALEKSKPISEKSALKTLNPFLDANNLLRVNGRLANCSLPYNERHPIILPGNSRLCYLYLRHLHETLIHGECNLLCRMVQTEFYISRLKARIKSIIYQCKICTIFKQKAAQQIMAPLPPERCDFTPPFHVTGIDFAGPFELKSSQTRNSPIVKGYVCVFVCFSTKAVHLEPCSDLSAAAFEAAFARFVGRRGLPRKVVSDNGGNFVGASRKMLREFKLFLKTSANHISQNYLTHGFEWSFIPPHAPHMGGLWEAAVKSFKYHFKRIAGTQRFTFEQMSTVLAKIEGVLNSRPISALSEDPNDFTALTPGHFIKGAPIVALPEPDTQNLSLVNKWEKLQALHHKFSIRWKEDYLKKLHMRYKWKNSIPNLSPGDLVVVMDDLLPPSEWRLGRIEKTYVGFDNNVRVADVQTTTGVITRPIVKLCYLPISNELESTENVSITNVI